MASFSPAAQPNHAGDPEAGHHGAGREHPRRVDHAEVQHDLRHLHVLPSPLRHRGPDQESEPRLVAGRDQIRDHDDGVRDGQQPRADPRRETPPGRLLRDRSGTREPPKAIDPGLVYDLTPQDYIPYLCGLYESYLVEVIVGRPVDCSSPKSIREGELNYPSISLTLPANNLKSVRYRRTVTNVGEPTSTYRVKLDVPQEVSATVTPTRLSFDELNQKQSFSISFRRNGGGSGAVQGQLLWVSTKHVVRSPISIRLE
ncbi:subtilisin-like protease [Musa troglodytarum]|uniref:Subtilisin-like protease n=2 Tax=Musa troglodytarum TaxID=320322 RepID=A0A9E7ERB0_9LILI|nr:subtilisin-like protease [Musa troglodytarum]